MSQHPPEFNKEAGAPDGNFLNIFDLFSYLPSWKTAHGISPEKGMPFKKMHIELIFCLLAKPINLCCFF